METLTSLWWPLGRCGCHDEQVVSFIARPAEGSRAVAEAFGVHKVLTGANRCAWEPKAALDTETVSSCLPTVFFASPAVSDFTPSATGSSTSCFSSTVRGKCKSKLASLSFSLVSNQQRKQKKASFPLAAMSQVCRITWFTSIRGVAPLKLWPSGSLHVFLIGDAAGVMWWRQLLRKNRKGTVTSTSTSSFFSLPLQVDATLNRCVLLQSNAGWLAAVRPWH